MKNSYEKLKEGKNSEQVSKGESDESEEQI